MRTSFFKVFLLFVIFSNVANAAIPHPRLVVVIAVDQFRGDYLTRYKNLFLPAVQKSGKLGGFRYLMDKGAYFQNAQTSHSLNVTAVGHAAMLTGANPYLHGIVSNYWYNSESEKLTYSVEDTNAPLIGREKETTSGRSPKNLLVSTLGDEMRNATSGKALVVSLSLKDRSAILLGGHRANLALWAVETSGSPAWISSKYYLPSGELPAWVQAFNKTDYMHARSPEQWTPLLKRDAYWMTSAQTNDMVGDGRGLGRAFPHPVKATVDSFFNSPWGNAYVLDAALEAVKNTALGADEIPDLLSISLSSFDGAGHNYGPYSLEMADHTVRLDRMLADFFNSLAKQIPGGMKNISIVLTADHGAQINPQLAQSFHLPNGAYWREESRDEANAFLRSQFGFDAGENPVARFSESNLYFDIKVLKKHKKDVNEVSTVLVEWMRKKSLFAEVYSKADVLAGHIRPTQTAQKLARSVHPLRSGDIVYSARPGVLELERHSTEGTGHESGASVHDANIPLIFVGTAFKTGRYSNQVYLNDLAPTLSTVLGVIAPSGSEGRVLSESLK